jgi:hypothetical protein
MKMYDFEVWVQAVLILGEKVNEYLPYPEAFSGEKYFPVSTG